MSTHSQQVVQKLWSYCNLLRDDGMSYGDYVEQLTYLLFLKMNHEWEQLHPDQPKRIPEEYNWQSLLDRDGDELETHYRHILDRLGKKPGMLGIIFRKAINKIQNPAHLRRLIIDLINNEDWSALNTDVKGDAYEGLLQKNAEDTKSGAGQYFTPRPLIDAIVEVMRPQAGQLISDPACGTGGFLLSAHRYIIKTRSKDKKLNRDDREALRFKTFRGGEIVDSTARLCLMNLFLHGIGGDNDDQIPIQVGDSLRRSPTIFSDIVLANPPFGRKSSMAVTTEKGKGAKEDASIVRDDFWTSTSNKQLNFVQHIYTMLKIGGRAAVVVPDNVLFEGGAGETIRRNLLETCDVHTLLRLPTGIFYANGVKANVLFFDKRGGGPVHATEKLWIYDLRTNQNFTLRTNPLTAAHLEDFISCYNPEKRGQRKETELFHSFSYDELIKRDKLSLDIFWLRDKSLEDADELPPPDVLIASIIEDLQSVIEQLATIGGNATEEAEEDIA